ncbi:copper homeostasis protein CutC [Mangrovibacterium diazotrophicum]|uniref:Copper homeostasis protein cutC homolog n=1 Tax=Mangrovibacterium diazotrophicum TaxID=1261403 RepID=A0A419W672_9BACT|nr:copper homeostasis protein CutC [Mangrovibacterium diazotrophicum]RKD90954.1 copper homeostasis protein [Mangrovibacterium diazotrophicum]
MSSKILVREACVETVAECVLAERRGANRLELCSDLANDGLTPSEELLDAVMAQVDIQIKAMVRPCAGGFLYTKDEIKQMEEEIAFFKSKGVYGVVFGVTTADNNLDIPVIKRLAELAKPMNVCVHKAIDSVNDTWADFQRLYHEVPEVDAVLTSGGEPTAKDGAALLRKMTELGGEKLKVVVAGKVTNDNIDELFELIGSPEYHGKKIVGPLV